MRTIVTGVLAGTAALSLLLAPAYAAPTRTSAADAGPDPTALAHLIQAQKYTDKTAWARTGGTYKSVCRKAAGGKYVQVRQLDLSTGAERDKMRASTLPDIPSVSVYKGRTEYDKVSATIRKSLRVHGVSSPAKWVTYPVSRRHPAEHPVLAVVRPTHDVAWDSLIETPLPGGGNSFTGSGHNDEDELTVEATNITDDTGRLVSATSQVHRAGGSVTECVESWDWSSPRIKVPIAKVRPSTARYRIEEYAVEGAADIKEEGNARLDSGETSEQVVAWLHERVRPKDRLTHGIVYTEKYPQRSALRFRIVVKHDAVDFRPIP